MAAMSALGDFDRLYRIPVHAPHERVCGITDRGHVRDENQDAYWIDPEFRFLVVADGLGGLPGGAVASALAVGEVASMVGDPSEDVGVLSSEAAERRLLAAFESAHACVRYEARAGSGAPAMSTTLACAWITPTRLYSMHCGDSRVYVLRDGAVVSVTPDHSLVGDLVRTGVLDRAEACSHPERNIVTQVIGSLEDPSPEFGVVPIRTGDVVMLCSDGLWEAVSEEEMAEVAVRETSAAERGAELLRRALDAGAHDNVTLVLYEHAWPA
jgi:serine/threonine protein phosphatase PrpC